RSVLAVTRKRRGRINNCRNPRVIIAHQWRCPNAAGCVIDSVDSFWEEVMKLKLLSLAASVSVAALTSAQAQILTGKVSSAEEPAMEGVLVSVKKEGSTITTTVVTNDKGEYSFPNDRIDAGKYAITIRAAGYVLDGPKSVEILAGGAKADLKLNKTRNLAAQLSNGEWLASVPGSDQQKQFLIGCTSRHTPQRNCTAPHDAEH